MKEEDQIAASKAIARLLRHRPDAAGLTLDAHGWCSVDALLEGLARTGGAVSREQLHLIVRTSDKQRFALSPDGQSIRANQGHSVSGVALQLRGKTPPAVLYHGTVASKLPAIEKQGLLPMNRHDVHLSADVATASVVGGRRRGEVVVLQVDSYRLHRDGVKFRISENGVWLVPAVPAKYLRRLPSAT